MTSTGCWPARNAARSKPPRNPLLVQPTERDRVVLQMAGAVAHQLKQPLAVAWGYLELILEEPNALDPITLRYLREINLAVHSMDDVVNRLQYATVYQTREYPGGLEILDFDTPQPAAD